MHPSNCSPIYPSIHPSAILLRCLVCLICNSKSFHFLICKLCIMIVHTLKMCTSYYVHISWIFWIPFFWGVLNLDIFMSIMLRLCLVCVICDSNSFHSLIFKLCIIIVHTLKMSTSYFIFVHILLFEGCWIICKTDPSEIERTYNIRKIAESVKLSLFMRTNGKCNNSHAP